MSRGVVYRQKVFGKAQRQKLSHLCQGDLRIKNNWLTDLLWGGFEIIFTFSLALKNITVMLVGWCEVWVHKYVYVLFKWGLNHFL